MQGFCRAVLAFRKRALAPVSHLESTCAKALSKLAQWPYFTPGRWPQFTLGLTQLKGLHGLNQASAHHGAKLAIKLALKV